MKSKSTAITRCGANALNLPTDAHSLTIMDKKHKNCPADSTENNQSKESEMTDSAQECQPETLDGWVLSPEQRDFIESLMDKDNPAGKQ